MGAGGGAASSSGAVKKGFIIIILNIIILKNFKKGGYQGLTYRKGDVYELRDPAVYNPWNNWLRALWWNNWFVVDITT